MFRWTSSGLTPRATGHRLAIAFVPLGAGSEHFEKVLERLGVARAVKARIVRGESGDTGVPVANGEAEIGVTLVFAAATRAEAKEPAASQALIDFLRTPEVATAFRAKGMEPG